MQRNKSRYMQFGLLVLLVTVGAGCKGVGHQSESHALGYSAVRPAAGELPAYATTAYNSSTRAGAVTSLERLPQSTDIRQDTCPVTGAKLGSMGPPVPVQVNGRTVFVCCAGCVENLRQNPERYLGRTNTAPLPGTSTATGYGQTSTREDSDSFYRPSSSGSGCSGSACCH